MANQLKSIALLGVLSALLVGLGASVAYDAVAELAARAQIPVPRLYLIPSPHANAFATGRNPERGVVAVTQGILDTLTARELRGVIAHEIAHIRNRDVLVASVAATVAATIGCIGNVLQWTTIFGGTSQQDRGSQVIVSPFAGFDTVLSWFSTHPPVRERIRRLRQMPPWRFAA